MPLLRPQYQDCTFDTLLTPDEAFLLAQNHKTLKRMLCCMDNQALAVPVLELGYSVLYIQENTLLLTRVVS